MISLANSAPLDNQIGFDARLLFKIFRELAALVDFTHDKCLFHFCLPYAIVSTLAPKSTVMVSPVNTVIAEP
jgi:hypothetical protein